ncbi:MAG: ribokinase, partial [Acidobacteriota bacterium]
GGKGANQAVAAAKCGADAHMVARVGDDLFGPATIDNFRTLGIGTEHVAAVTGASSGVAPIFVEPSGENRILVVKGANDEVTPAVVDAATPLIETADVVILQFEIPLTTVLHTVRLAAELGTRCILNPAPAAEVDLDAIASVDYFVPNESEAATLTGLPVTTVDEARACAEHLLQRGFRRVILTLGERGALLASAKGSELVPAYPVQPVDTSGAGDAFIGSFATFLAEGASERDAVAHANLYAGLSTQGIGTQTSLVSREHFEREWQRLQ